MTKLDKENLGLLLYHYSTNLYSQGISLRDTLVDFYEGKDLGLPDVEKIFVFLEKL